MPQTWLMLAFCAVLILYVASSVLFFYIVIPGLKDLLMIASRGANPWANMAEQSREDARKLAWHKRYGFTLSTVFLVTSLFSALVGKALVRGTSLEGIPWIRSVLKLWDMLM